jgi:hypothetical protein
MSDWAIATRLRPSPCCDSAKTASAIASFFAEGRPPVEPIADKARILLDFPDKTYIGSFGRDAKFEVGIDADGFLLKFVRGGEKKRTFELHVHPRLMADIVTELAEALRQHPIEDGQQRERLLAGFKEIEKALS